MQWGCRRMLSLIPTSALTHEFIAGHPLGHREVGLTLPREKAFLGWFMVKCMLTLKLSSLGSFLRMCRSYNPTMYFPTGCYQSPVTTVR